MVPQLEYGGGHGGHGGPHVVETIDLCDDDDDEDEKKPILAGSRPTRRKLERVCISVSGHNRLYLYILRIG